MVFEARHYPPVIEDDELVMQIRVLSGLNNRHISNMVEAGRIEEVTYYKGIVRGLTMAMEAYLICLESKAEAQRRNTESSSAGQRYSIGADNKLKPQGSDPTDQS